jgi:hypothetical protein
VEVVVVEEVEVTTAVGKGVMIEGNWVEEMAELAEGIGVAARVDKLANVECTFDTLVGE